MKFCSQCSATVILQIPEGDHRPRHICVECGIIHYSNPKVVAGCLVEHDNKILLCKRNIEPRKGSWTLPAGFMENLETSAEGAARETFEETLATVKVGNLFVYYDIPHISQIYMLYLASMDKADYGPTPESSEVSLLSESEIPWDKIAFPVITKTLEHYYTAKKSGNFNLQHGVIDRRTENQSN